MASNPPPTAGNSLPRKPWEAAGSSSTAGPFKPPSSGSTSDVVESSGTARPGVVPATQRNAVTNGNTLARPVPSRPWESNYGNSYGGYGSGLNHNSGFSGGMYSSYGAFGGSYGSGGLYGGGLYGNNMFNRGYGSLYGGSGTYGGGGYGGPMGGYGMPNGAPYDGRDPNNPYGPPSSPPGFWVSFLRVMHGVVDFFGRIAVLIDQNTQAFYLFMSALLQLFDRSGLLYGELARFVLRLLGFRMKPRKLQPHLATSELPGPEGKQPQQLIEGPKVAPPSSWEGVWGQDGFVEGSS